MIIAIVSWFLLFFHDGQAWQLFSWHGDAVGCKQQIERFVLADIPARCVEFRP